MAKRNSEKKTLKSITGTVLKIGTPNTATVTVKIEQRHPIYKKIVRHNNNYTVHVEEGAEVAVGDMVEIVPTRPYSKTKSWKLVKVVEAA